MPLFRRSWRHCMQCIKEPNKLTRQFSSKQTGSGSGGSRWPRRVLSGLQPTGELHVGNYFGAVRRCVQLQDGGDDLMLCIADLHALTAPGDPALLQRRVLELAAVLLAAGVDPERAVLFRQSAVPRHAELCWALACAGTEARLHHLPQYRERAARTGDTPLGVLLYPVLQAADVLLYRATHVPVGADQLPHLQLAAQLVRSFHHRHRCRIFPEPQALLPEDGSDRVRSLRDPSKKMSKSDPDVKSRILLSDSDDTIALKVRKAVTDCTPEVTFEPDTRPGVANLVLLHCLAADLTPEEAVVEAEGLTTARYKQEVARALAAAVAPVRARAAALLARPAHLSDVLRDGAARARARADRTYEEAAAAMGVAPADAAPAPAHKRLVHVL